MEIITPHIVSPGYKLSGYNSFVLYEDGKIVVYNFLYRSLLVFDNLEAKKILSGELTDQMASVMVQHQILVPVSWDEWSYYQYNYLARSYNEENLSLAIMPTLRCNCACPYCFEKKGGVPMNMQVQNELLQWVESILPAKRSLTVDWFGGEPLLCQNTIDYLSTELQALCKRYEIPYAASITTNGVLLNSPEMIGFLRRNNIVAVQVTFDGGRAAHNEQKFLRDGSGTYDQLLSNALLFVKQWPEQKLRIRVNVSDTNIDTIDELMTDLFPVKDNSVIFFRWVYANEASEWKDFSTQSKGDNPYQKLYELQCKAISQGFVIDDQIERQGFFHCEADNAAFYTIDPLGNIYTCVHEFDPKFSVGNIRSGMDIEKQADYFRFRNATLMEDDECRQCLLLPMCNGGCRRYRITHGQHQCIYEKQSPDLYIDMLYRNSILKNKLID